eukprot:TRINITY_DN12006_c0_g1_i2.p1 TRINITY_DN12006_c0_g1~~TRINITY_DN12006_c0_g1_i2.p1  ORF type:complete len:340 (+),score=61.53 TRINITY_DN12006_c0_g1_i2:60-1079(+)
MAGLSSYEQQRLENIKTNQEKLRALGFATAPDIEGPPDVADLMRAEATPSRKRAKTTKPPKQPSLPTRRSSRRRAQPQRFDAETDQIESSSLQHSSDDDDNDPSTPVHRKLGVEQANEDAIERCREAMLALKQQLDLDSTARTIVSASSDAEGLRKEACRRWGPHVPALEAIPDWSEYVSSRTSRLPPLPSPYALMQERFAADPWYLLCSCILMSRVSSSAVKERCIGGFFTACPTPSAMLSCDPATLKPILHSLGLFPSRLEGLMDLTTKFLTMPSFRVGLDKTIKVKGVGAFGVESYQLFCRDERIQPTDKNLRAFANWRSSVTAAGALVKEEEKDE